MSEGSGLSGMTVPRLAPGVRLSHDPRRERWVLLAPERVLEPDEVGTEILRCIDGEASIDRIVERLSTTFEADPGEIAGDVRTFIADLARRRVLLL